MFLKKKLKFWSKKSIYLNKNKFLINLNLYNIIFLNKLFANWVISFLYFRFIKN